MSTVSSNIKDILLTGQNVISTGVSAIAEIQETHEAVQEAVATFDTKISVHDADEEAHPYIQSQTGNVANYFMTTPTYSGMSIATENTPYALTVYSASRNGLAEISHFYITVDDVIHIIENEGTVADGHATFYITFDEPREDIRLFITAYDDAIQVHSQTTICTLTCIAEIAPDFSNMSHTLPDRVSNGSSYTFQVSGITDVNTNIETISVTADAPEVKFTSSGTNTVTIAQDTDITFTMDGEPTADYVQFTIKAEDDKDLYTTDIHTAENNRFPDVSLLAHNVTTNLVPSTSDTVRVSGVTDANGDTITMSPSSNNAGITFSKTSGIALNEDFTMSVGALAYGTAYEIYFDFVDGYGGTTRHTISSVINTPPDMTNFVCTKNEYQMPGEVATISFSGVTDSNQSAVVYAIPTNTSGMLSFSKTTGISASEDLTLTVSSSAVRGTTYNITVSATDNEGVVSTVTVGFTINRLISAVVTSDVDEYIVPDRQTSFTLSGTDSDPDGHTLRYILSSTNSDVTFTNATSVLGGTTFTITPPTETELARSSTWDLIFTANDGYEDVVTTKTITQSPLPTTTGLSVSYSEDLYGGTENTLDVTITGGTDPKGRAITYNLLDIDDGLTFAQTSGIESVVTLYADKVTSATTKTFKVQVVDSFNETSLDTVEFTVTVNPILRTVAPSITAPIDGDDTIDGMGFTVTWTEYDSFSWTGDGLYPNNTSDITADRN